jgi:hypothetical protein
LTNTNKTNFTQEFPTEALFLACSQKKENKTLYGNGRKLFRQQLMETEGGCLSKRL